RRHRPAAALPDADLHPVRCDPGHEPLPDRRRHGLGRAEGLPQGRGRPGADRRQPRSRDQAARRGRGPPRGRRPHGLRLVLLPLGSGGEPAPVLRVGVHPSDDRPRPAARLRTGRVRGSILVTALFVAACGSTTPSPPPSAPASEPSASLAAPSPIVPPASPIAPSSPSTGPSVAPVAAHPTPPDGLHASAPHTNLTSHPDTTPATL